MSKKISQSALILQYYIDHPKDDIPHFQAVDWASKEWERITGLKFRDPDRAVRKLAQNGQLIKISKGIYRYDPDYINARILEDFTPAQKLIIMKNGEYKCAVCGKTKDDGVDLQIDHIKPKEYGGAATIENGQILCAQHNYLKKKYSQTEAGKRVFIRLHTAAQVINDKRMMDFTNAILNVYREYGIDDHIN